MVDEKHPSEGMDSLFDFYYWMNHFARFNIW